MEVLKGNFKNAFCYIKAFIKWVLIAVSVGLIGGAIGSLFHKAIDFALELRGENRWLVLLLPLGGVLIAGIYALFKNKGVLDTNRVLESAETGKKVPLVMTPMIFISTVLTQMLGGSAGREGAALQLGGSVGYNIGRLLKLNEKDSKEIVMSGMASVFSALFGTPVTAAIFAIEVSKVGVMHYASLVPTVIASLTAYYVSALFKITPFRFGISAMSGFDLTLILKIMVLAVLCAVVSILFCLALKYSEKYFDKFLNNCYLRGFIGGFIIVILTVAVGSSRYNGAGMDIVIDAFSGKTYSYDFILKIIFTAITIAAGFKGGEIVPAFFIGSTFGAGIAGIMGMNVSLGAAIGFVSLFCGVVNCPIASIILAVEMFGSDNLLFYALAVAICYMLSGKIGLYKVQKIACSKIEEE